MRGITPIGITTFRHQGKAFGIRDQDRFGHIYCIGKTGTGKSTLLLNMAISDIQRGNGVCIIDPHGDLAETILDYIPRSRVNDIVYFNPQDTAFPTAFNPLYNIPPDQHHIAVSGLISTFKKIWAESWGPRLEYILRFSLHTLLEYPNATLLDLQPLLTDHTFRNHVLTYSKSTSNYLFWQNEFNTYSPALRAEAIAPILNKVGVFATSALLRNIIGQRERSIDITHIMHNKMILIANLAKGAIGEDVTSLLGSMLINSIQTAALSRYTQKEEDRIPFYVYVDEMQSFVSLSFADMLSEARKFKVSLFLTHQYIDQVHEKIHAAVMGNAGTLICFRVGSADADTLSAEFKPPFDVEDMIALKRYHLYIKLMIDGATSKPFSAQTLPLPQHRYKNKSEVVECSRRNHADIKERVEQHLLNHTYKPQPLKTLFE
jgi:hypothetical protein